ncbi:hypothetical protein DQ239_03055 [Blastococcus sp. TF02-09]|nr:hypothetical protein DQ239_03055 [Blastococcus sp. TF02-9]
MRRALLVLLAVLVMPLPTSTAHAAGSDCEERFCSDVSYGEGALEASFLGGEGDASYADRSSPPANPYRYRLLVPCVVSDAQIEACRPSDFRDCNAAPDRVVNYYIVERQRLMLPDNTTIDGFVPIGPPPPPGTPVGEWENFGRRCVDVTALDPPPSPAEVFRYFQTLPLPQLPTQQQPPGDGLVGLPVIFFTDGPTTQTFTLDIRGFTVDITATATSFTWHTGDGTDLTTTGPGAPYPDHTITHDYASGSYTASLTTTWTATFTIDGGLTVPVPGSTTTDGPPVTFDVLQARPVLTNPFD